VCAPWGRAAEDRVGAAASGKSMVVPPSPRNRTVTDAYGLTHSPLSSKDVKKKETKNLSLKKQNMAFLFCKKKSQ
jgi:hypothetical protein